MESILTKYTDYCVLCGRPNTEPHHLIMGSKRKNADTNLLILPTCRPCHEKIHGNSTAFMLSKILGQVAFEKQKIIEGESAEDAREKFRTKFGKSYL